jgi:hypothetical protein
MYKFKYRNTRYIKKQDNMTLPKDNNSTIMGSNDSEIDEILNKELKRTIIKLINKIKQDTYK